MKSESGKLEQGWIVVDTLELDHGRDRNMLWLGGETRPVTETRTPQGASPPACRHLRCDVDNTSSVPEPKWCSLRGALDWVVFGRSPQSPSTEDMVLGPPTWPDNAEIRHAKSAILLAIDKGSPRGLDHFFLRVDNRYPYIFQEDEPSEGKMSSVSSLPGVNFETSRHEGWRPECPQIFVRVADQKRIFPEPLAVRTDAVAADVPASAANSPLVTPAPVPASPVPVAGPKRLSDREARAAYQAWIKPFVEASTRTSREDDEQWGRSKGLCRDEVRIIRDKEAPQTFKQTGKMPNRAAHDRILASRREQSGKF